MLTTSLGRLASWNMESFKISDYLENYERIAGSAMGTCRGCNNLVRWARLQVASHVRKCTEFSDEDKDFFKTELDDKLEVSKYLKNFTRSDNGSSGTCRSCENKIRWGRLNVAAHLKKCPGISEEEKAHWRIDMGFDDKIDIAEYLKDVTRTNGYSTGLCRACDSPVRAARKKVAAHVRACPNHTDEVKAIFSKHREGMLVVSQYLRDFAKVNGGSTGYCRACDLAVRWGRKNVKSHIRRCPNIPEDEKAQFEMEFGDDKEEQEEEEEEVSEMNQDEPKRLLVVSQYLKNFAKVNGASTGFCKACNNPVRWGRKTVANHLRRCPNISEEAKTSFEMEQEELKAEEDDESFEVKVEPKKLLVVSRYLKNFAKINGASTGFCKACENPVRWGRINVSTHIRRCENIPEEEKARFEIEEACSKKRSGDYIIEAEDQMNFDEPDELEEDITNFPIQKYMKDYDGPRGFCRYCEKSVIRTRHNVAAHMRACPSIDEEMRAFFAKRPEDNKPKSTYSMHEYLKEFRNESRSGKCRSCKQEIIWKKLDLTVHKLSECTNSTADEIAFFSKEAEKYPDKVKMKATTPKKISSTVKVERSKVKVQHHEEVVNDFYPPSECFVCKNPLDSSKKRLVHCLEFSKTPLFEVLGE